MMTYLDLEVTILVEGQEYAVQVTVEIIEEGESDTMIEGDFFPRLNLLENEGGLYSVNGKPFTGEAISYYSNKQKEWEIHYRSGQIWGPVKAWYENGEKALEEYYRNGKRNGYFLVWHENGHRRFLGSFKDGKLHGEFIEWHENGKKKSESCYKNGEPYFVDATFDERGFLKSRNFIG